MNAVGSPDNDPSTSHRGVNGWLKQNRTGLFALAAGSVLVFGWSWWRGLGAPQRIGDVPNPFGFKGFLNGEAVSEPEPGAILATRLPGGATRTLVQPASQGSPRSKAIASRLTPAGLLYFVDESPPASRPAPYAGGAVGGPVVPVEYRQVAPSEMRSATAIRESGDYAAYLLPRAGDAKPIRVARHLNNLSVVIAGNTAYWIEQWHWTNLPVSIRAIRRNGTMIVPVLPPCNRLMRATLGGEAQHVRDVNLAVLEVPGPSGVVWTEAANRRRPFSSSLNFLASRAAAPVQMHDYAGEGVPVEYRGRLYWVQPTNREESISPDLARTVDLVSAPLSLSTTRRERTLRIRGQFARIQSTTGTGGSPLVAHRSALYALCSGDTAADDASAFPAMLGGPLGPPAALYALVTEGRASVQKVATFPRVAHQFSIDGGDIYTVVTEERENWMDWSRQGLTPSTAQVAYRFHLPE